MAEADTSSASVSHPLIESDHIEGTAVYDANGKKIGTIKRLVVEKVSGHVVYAVTSFGGFLGLGSETHTIPWEQLHYDPALHGYKTPITEEQLHKAPEFSRRDLSSPVVMTLSCLGTSASNSATTTVTCGSHPGKERVE
jgi:sporulation protein YlmC with PRC-barrel domain